MEKIKQARAISRRKFTRKVNTFRAAVGQHDPTPVLQSIYDELIIAYKEVEENHERYVNCICEELYDEKLLDETDSYISELERNKVEIHSLLIKSKGNGCGDTKDKIKVKVKALEPPVFEGDIREYPSFKADFERLMQTNYGKDPFALKQCLRGEALRTVKGADSDYNEMFRRLDDKYGNSRKVVDVIINDLKSLKRVTDGDGKQFVKMIDKVERCWLDLKNMKLESEMNSATIVSHIEKILPSPQKREWVITAEHIEESSELFPELMTFLLREKRAIEYMESGIRSAGGVEASGSVHSVAGHSDKQGNQPHQMSETAQAIKRLEESQESKNRKFEESIANLTRMVSNITTQRPSGFKSVAGSGNKCCIHSSDTHTLTDCKTFQNLDNSNKLEVLMQHGVCFKCLKVGHLLKNCFQRRNCEVQTDQGICGRPHHSLLHPAHTEGMILHGKSKFERSHVKKVLLMINRIYSNKKPINTLWDPGSDITIMTHALASRLGLKGKDINLSMTKVGNSTECFTSKEYTLELTDKEGRTLSIQAIGINEISSRISNVNTSKLADIFGIDHADLERPCGVLDLLIGCDYSELLPTVVATEGRLQLMQNQFGYCLRGPHPLIDMDISEYQCSHLLVKINHLASAIHVNDIIVEPRASLKANLDNFFSIESLGTHCFPKCGDCKCGKCSLGNQNFSIKEERELHLIEEGLIYDEKDLNWTVKYPWIKDPKLLPNNVSQAYARMKSTERRLTKLGSNYAKMYNDQIHDLINRNVAHKLSHKELNQYRGPVYYVQHHEVLKRDSTSTPVRIVFNSSARYRGQALNDYWAKGPDVLNNLFGVLLRFRQGLVAVMGDISKMYNAIRLSELDQHTHRFLWRDLNIDSQPDHYVLTAMSFGDRPSGPIAMLALKQTVEMYRDVFPKVTEMVVSNSYVDDILHSLDSRTDALKLLKDTEQVLLKGGFKIKHWVVSGSNFEVSDVKILDTQREKVLGITWNPVDDYFSYKIRLCFSLKPKQDNSSCNLDLQTFDDFFPNILTKRMVLSQVATVYDPFGFLIPVILKAKTLMREMINSVKIPMNDKGKCLDWDEPLAEEIRCQWKSFFRQLYDVEKLKFCRCLKPKNYIENPILILFSDGSKQAYGACAYIRWETPNDRIDVRLIAAKNRIAPSKQLTIPRLELCGAVLACRLRETIQKECDWQFASIFHIVDSAIVRSQIQKESYGFGTFVANKVAEIQSKSCASEWWWVSSGNNPADLTTRPCHPRELADDSVWQKGQSFLYQPVSTWPISQVCHEELPDRVGITVLCNSEKYNHLPINIRRFSSYNKLIRVTARLLNACKVKSLKGISYALDVESLKEAEQVWIEEVQKDLPLQWETVYQRLGPVKSEDGIILVGQRIAKWLKDNWNQDRFVLLPSNHYFTRLYVEHLHKIDHAGVEVTLAKLQTKFWVPAARKLIRSVRKNCVACRKLDSRVEGQSMGQVIGDRIQPCPPFYHTAIDLFGPFQVKDTVKRRTKCKVYGVIFNCIVSRSVYLDLSESYSTEDFLSTFRRFVSLRGYPGSVYSDGGSQLVAASKELRQMTKHWDWTEILKFGTNQGMTWIVNKSADAPWQNGYSESLIKSVKKALTISIGGSILTFGELQTVFFEVANLLNERPIGIKPGTDVNMGTYLCPNDLLLGRATAKTPAGIWNTSSNVKQRLEFINSIVNSFWKKWQRDYFPTLIVQQKWHTDKRNVSKGDVVLIQDSSLVKGKWRLGQVAETFPGRDGKVRDVTIRYKLQKPGAKYHGQSDIMVKRSVHRLVVLLPVEDQEFEFEFGKE